MLYADIGLMGELGLAETAAGWAGLARVQKNLSHWPSWAIVLVSQAPEIDSSRAQTIPSA